MVNGVRLAAVEALLIVACFSTAALGASMLEYIVTADSALTAFLDGIERW